MEGWGPKTPRMQSKTGKTLLPRPRAEKWTGWESRNEDPFSDERVHPLWGHLFILNILPLEIWLRSLLNLNNFSKCKKTQCGKCTTIDSFILNKAFQQRSRVKRNCWYLSSKAFWLWRTNVEHDTFYSIAFCPYRQESDTLPDEWSNRNLNTKLWKEYFID